ncbi:RNA methyltransferase [Hymenobacter sp. DG25A]|jgi:tRNA G18 (ribose-2'-O)-methylase SpoU|uniref:RNA methyltransferase n=1 Tax=Hymenobacter sp. DG25A TaxID=1385663 RepID=UPI0006BCC92B|nr:RNA methyltransferase [Hymenobacter sp. DG25A]ALD19935.1 RNA methyltransferase [Hymenobacter sp. DG25A]
MRKLSMEELNRLTVADFKNTQKFPLTLVLDNVRSLHNVGAAFRTADAFAIEKMWLCGITGRPPQREITKTALGSTESVVWEYAASTLEVVRQLQAAGYVVVAVEQTTGSLLLPAFELEPGRPYALVMGNEVFGVDDEVLAQCDAAVEIPQFGTKHSLNVSVAAGVVLWDFLTKMGFQAPVR